MVDPSLRKIGERSSHANHMRPAPNGLGSGRISITRIGSPLKPSRCQGASRHSHSSQGRIGCPHRTRLLGDRERRQSPCRDQAETERDCGKQTNRRTIHAWSYHAHPTYISWPDLVLDFANSKRPLTLVKWRVYWKATAQLRRCQAVFGGSDNPCARNAVRKCILSVFASAAAPCFATKSFAAASTALLAPFGNSIAYDFSKSASRLTNSSRARIEAAATARSSSARCF